MRSVLARVILGMPHLSDTETDSDHSEDEDEDFVPKSRPGQVPRAPRKSAAEFFAEVSPAPASGNPHARGRAAAAASLGVVGAQGAGVGGRRPLPQRFLLWMQ